MLPQTSRQAFLARFAFGDIYHVYNRTNNREPLFRCDADRRFFLHRYKTYLYDFVDTYAYSLLDNHFHLAIRVKQEEALCQILLRAAAAERTISQKIFLEQPDGERDAHLLIENQFTRFFTSYAMYINRRYERKGNFFHRPFKRVEVADENHLLWLIYYIHHNPLKHGLVRDFTLYPWTSYPSILNSSKTSLQGQCVLEWFGGREAFEDFQRRNQEAHPLYSRWAIEDKQD